MSRRVFLHVGAPKTGTTFLQDRLSRNVKTLADHGVHFPNRSAAVPATFHFRAALDLLGQDWGGPSGHAEGAWDAMMRRVQRRSGTVIISHEILAPAPTDVVARAREDLADSELHILYTARDLARQVPASWQESIKQGRRWTYRDYLNRLEGGKPWFYRAFDLPSVLALWGADLPPERVHVITVPPSGAPRDVLWNRFCDTVGIDPAWAPIEAEQANESLGPAESQVIRKLNRRMQRRTRRSADFDPLIRKLAQNTLAGSSRGTMGLPEERYPWAEAETERWVEWIEASGVDVVGDVEELRPAPLDPDVRYVDPDGVSNKRQLKVALDALAAMTHEAARRRDPDQQLISKARRQASWRRRKR